MTRSSETRPVLAGLLSVVQPGLGHLYLREWVRALLWAGLWTTSLALVVTTADVGLTGWELVAAFLGLFAILAEFPLEAVVSTFAVTLFATLDAYWLAARQANDRASTEERCPHCGKELDPALEFCHWCTTTLETEESA